MDIPRIQIRMVVLLALVAGVAVNFWLFRFSLLWGLIGLSILKHVLIAGLCQILGVDRRARPLSTDIAAPAPDPVGAGAAPSLCPALTEQPGSTAVRGIADSGFRVASAQERY